MAKHPNTVFESPVGDLEWVIIEGEGKENLNGDMQYVCSVVLGGDKAKEAIAQIDAFWEENRPKGIKEPKSLGYQPHKVKTEETDEDGDPVYEETGKTVLQFKTGTTYNDGKPKKIKVFNAKGAEVDLGDKKIGNGSRGRVKGILSIYTVEQKGKIINAGCTLYLNGIQIAKFVEFVGGPRFDEIDEEEADFEGVGDMGAVPDESAEEQPKQISTKSKPRL